MEAAVTRQRRPRRQTLTDKQVAALPRRRDRYFFPDPELPKHGIRVMPTGPSSYYTIIRDRYGKQRWIRLGSTAELTIAQSREAARSVIQRVKQGLEPFPAPPVKPDSVTHVIENYFKRHAHDFRSAREKQRIVERHVLPVWRHQAFVEIGRSDLSRLCDAVEDKHGPWVADSVHTQVSAIAHWYAARHDSYVPPFTRGMKRVKADRKRRARILSDAELQRVWKAAGNAGAYGVLVKLALLTGQRRAALATMKWSDLQGDVWNVRAEPRAKSAGGALKLPKIATAIVRGLPRFASNPYVFASGHGAGPIAAFSRHKSALDRASNVHNWVLHDCRRTARSLLARANVRPDVAERVLGHAIPGVEGIYNRHSYDGEKADALKRLAALVERVVAGLRGGNVVQMHEAAVSS